jgi:chromosome segregation ATPase
MAGFEKLQINTIKSNLTVLKREVTQIKSRLADIERNKIKLTDRKNVLEKEIVKKENQLKLIMNIKNLRILFAAI